MTVFLPVSERVRRFVAKLVKPSHTLYVKEGTRDHTFLAQTLAELEKECEDDTKSLIEALVKARDTFNWYGDMHAAKPDMEKAKRNYDLRDEMNAAIEAYNNFKNKKE